LAKDSANPSVIRRLVDTAWSAGAASADPDDPQVRGFAEFGLPPASPLTTDDQLHALEAWRDDLKIPANGAFLDGTLLLTVKALLDSDREGVLTPVTLWELTTFIDALVCFDRLYCIANPSVDVAHFNQRLGTEVLSAIPDPDGGVLRKVAGRAAIDGVSDMRLLHKAAGRDDAWGQEVQAVVDGWRAIFGPKFPGDGLFDINAANIGLTGSRPPAASPKRLYEGLAFYSPPSGQLADGDLEARTSDPTWPEILIWATRVPESPATQADRFTMRQRRYFASGSTYRTYVNQGIANALALPYLPSTPRMPFRKLFVRRAGEVQDELVSVALADRIFAQQQPSSPLILPFFTAAVLQRAGTREDIWAQMATVRDQSVAFRRVRAELDRSLERSEVSTDALRFQNAVRDEALRLADVAGAAQQSASVALGVLAQTGIVPLAGALKVGVDAARGVGGGGSWTRIWRRLFHRHEHFLAETNAQAIALTNSLPQLQQLWQMPKIGGYLKRFADATQQIGHLLRD
jgi:hypothetical protein